MGGALQGRLDGGLAHVVQDDRRVYRLLRGRPPSRQQRPCGLRAATGFAHRLPPRRPHASRLPAGG
eukprot:8892610-Alexandrium_andersonii.AAC.1